MKKTDRKLVKKIVASAKTLQRTAEHIYRDADDVHRRADDAHRAAETLHREVRNMRETISRKRTGSKREIIPPPGDQRYVRRDERGRIRESADVSRSPGADRRGRAKSSAKRGPGDQGDRPRAKNKRG